MCSVGERLKDARVLVEGLSARELDRLAELSEGHVSLIECGDRPNPTRNTLESLSRVLGVDPGWLSFGSGKGPTAKLVRASVEAARSKRSAA